NPLLLLGETGVGKSLFAELLVDGFRLEHRDSSVAVVPGSDFARGFAEAVKADALEAFRTRYARVDLLMLDNLEELAEKEPAQQELRKVVDELLARGGRLIAASRMPLDAGRWLTPALASRLGSGLTVPIRIPDLATRHEILLQEAR